MGQNPTGFGSKKRLSADKESRPTYALIDSQSVKTTGAAQDRGFDGGKKVKGRKRHIVVDTMGNLLSVVVHAAHIHDTKSGIFAAEKALAAYPSIRAFSADAGYRNTFERQVWERFAVRVNICERINHSWEVLPKRWVVERTFSWFNGARRLAKDFEISLLSAESLIKLAHIGQILQSFK